MLDFERFSSDLSKGRLKSSILKQNFPGLIAVDKTSLMHLRAF